MRKRKKSNKNAQFPSRRGSRAPRSNTGATLRPCLNGPALHIHTPWSVALPHLAKQREAFGLLLERLLQSSSLHLWVFSLSCCPLGEAQESGEFCTWDFEDGLWTLCLKEKAGLLAVSKVSQPGWVRKERGGSFCRMSSLKLQDINACENWYFSGEINHQASQEENAEENTQRGLC